MRNRAAFVTFLALASLAAALPAAGEDFPPRPAGSGAMVGAFAAPPGGAAAVGAMTRESLEAALRQGGVTDPKLVEQAVRTQAKGPYSVALFCLRQATTMNPLDLRYPFLMGCCLLHVGHGNQALTFIDEAVAAAPKDPRPLNLKAEYLRGLGDADAYISTLQKSLEVDPSQGKVHYRLARALLQRDKPGDLIDAFDHAKRSVGNFQARAEELADRFPAGEQRNWFLDRAAALRTDRAVTAFRADQGPARGRIYAPPRPEPGTIAPPEDAPSPPPPAPIDPRTGYSATDSSFKGGEGPYHVMGQDEFFQIKAGDLPKYERLKAVRERRRAERQ